LEKEALILEVFCIYEVFEGSTLDLMTIRGIYQWYITYASLEAC